MWDTNLFLWLNFDGGALLDSLMLFTSGRLSWVPLYLLILWLVWRRRGWRGVALVVVAIALAVGISDILAGIFKHTGLLKHLLSDFPARLRPMYTPELEGVVHFLQGGGQYGTISAHAATSISIGVIATRAVPLRWFRVVMWTQVALVCYSRIYLGYHFPQDIILGAGVGVVAGVTMWLIIKRWLIDE